MTGVQTCALPIWMIDGKAMDFDEFIETLFPQDCAEKTFLVLKYKGTDDANNDR